MGLYANVTKGVVVGVVVCDDPAYATEQGWTPLQGVNPQPGPGWTYDGTTWVAPELAPTAQQQVPVTVDPDVLSGLVDQATAATTVAQVKAALLATLNALGADT
jgi:hypothetical protein